MVKLAMFAAQFGCVPAALTAEPDLSRGTTTPPLIVYKPSTDAFYPAASRELSEQGTVKIKICYDTTGRATAVDVDERSGHVRLDHAAVRWGMALRIRPGTIFGQLQPACALLNVRFSLDETQEELRREDELQLLPMDVPRVLDSLPLPPPPRPGRFIPLEREAVGQARPLVVRRSVVH